MVKILFMINYLKNGGPSRIVMNLINNLNQEEYDITVMTLKNRNDESILKKLEKMNIKIINMNFNSNKKVIFNTIKIRKMIYKNRFTIVHSHGIIPDYICNSLKIVKISTLHSNIKEDYLNSYGTKYGKLLCKFHIRLLKKFNQVCCCSKSVYESLKSDIHKSSFIRNGIDIKANVHQKSSIRKELEIPRQARVYIYSGRLVPGKRIEELIELFNNYKNEEEYLLVLGTGPLYEKLLKYNSKSVKLLGFKKNIYDYYLESDIYISNSASEGFSISVIEALGCGLYLLISDIPSHRECFEIDSKKYIGEYFDYKTFKTKKEIIVKRMKMEDRRNLLAFQKQYLSESVMANNYKKIYQKELTKQYSI